jgi:hypothetical protein
MWRGRSSITDRAKQHSSQPLAGDFATARAGASARFLPEEHEVHCGLALHASSMPRPHGRRMRKQALKDRFRTINAHEYAIASTVSWTADHAATLVSDSRCIRE